MSVLRSFPSAIVRAEEPMRQVPRFSSPAVLAIATVIAIGLIATTPSALGAEESRAVARARAAIDSIRGHDLRKLSSDEKEKLGDRLDQAWKTLRKRPKIAKEAIRETLDSETADSFLLIDLSLLYLTLDADSGALADAARWLLRADPNAYPSSYFEAASGMAGERCAPCLPAVLKMLELERLDAYVPEHALPVDLDLGFLFTIGPYGDLAVPGVASALDSENCTTSKNAATMLGFLLPERIPVQLKRAVSRRTCPEVREAAWRTLGVLGDPALAARIHERLKSGAAVSSAEKLAMVEALQLPYRLPPLEPLDRLAEDENPEVRAAAFEAKTKRIENQPTAASLVDELGSAGPDRRRETLSILDAAAAKGVLDFEGSARELEAGLGVGDLSLVNAAKASVLRRHSDECVYEWKKLYLAATLLRELADSDEREAP